MLRKHATGGLSEVFSDLGRQRAVQDVAGSQVPMAAYDLKVEALRYYDDHPDKYITYRQVPTTQPTTRPSPTTGPEPHSLWGTHQIRAVIR